MASLASAGRGTAASPSGLFSSAPRVGATFFGCLEFRETPGGGSCGLHTRRSFARGEVVFRQAPTVFVQNQWNARHAPACLNCGLLLGGNLRSLLGAAFATCPPSAGRLSWELLDRSGLFERASLALPGPVRPPAEAAGALFCSSTCEAAQAERGHHRVLAVDADDARRAAWARFREHSARTCDTFELAGILVAQAIADTLHGGLSPGDAVAKHTQYASAPWPEMAVMSEAAAASGGEEGAAAVRRRRWQVLRESRALLVGALGGCAPAEVRDGLLSEEGYARLAGLVELTSKDLRRDGPLNAAVESALRELPREVRVELGKISAAWMRARIASRRLPEFFNWCWDDPDEEEAALDSAVLGETVLPALPGFEGFGIVPLIGLMNHSCSPNVRAKVSPVNVEVVGEAMEDIPAGGELCLSYLGSNPSPSRAVRQAQLQERFLFLCRCRRCLAESAPAE